jgi:hypothetical protein
MKTRNILVTALLCLVALLPAAAQWDWGRAEHLKAGACFYRGDHFRGDAFCMRIADRWASLPRGFNDSIKSIRVFGGARLRVFNDDNFRGVSLLIDHNINDLRQIPVADNPRKNWNDRISSIAVFRAERDEWMERR